MEVSNSENVILKSFYQTTFPPDTSTRVVIQFQNRSKKESYLKKCFSALVNRKEIHVPQDVAKYIFTSDLEIKLEVLNITLQCVLLDSLVYFMIVWPGWNKSKRYFSGSLSFEEWFGKFKQYLIFQVNNIIKNEYKYLAARPTNNIELNTVDKEKMTEGDLTEKSDQKTENAVGICIGGPLHYLNNIVFCEKGNDVIVKEHIHLKWRDLRPEQLVNWPYVAVTVNFKGIQFTRKCKPEVKRYLDNRKPVTIDKNSHLVHTPQQITKNGVPHNVFSYTFISTYINQFITCARQTIKDVSHVDELEVIMKQLLDDVRESNPLQQIATNTTVSYTIGGSTYARNKKIQNNTSKETSDSSHNIAFYEFIRPKIEYTLHNLNIIDSTVKQCYFDNFQLNFEQDRFPNRAITYTCLFCNVSCFGCDGIIKMAAHIQEVHQAESPVICTNCGKEFDFYHLTSLRYKHSFCRAVTT